tara:strand:- start:53480 stop:53722 length:243 start_codon:yes stop_codon:yes gene_type:complete
MEDFYKDMENNELDQELADEAMRNTYDFIIKGYDWDSLPEAYWMLDDPEGKEAINSLIDYFTGTEEYEKCAKLVKLLRKK